MFFSRSRSFQGKRHVHIFVFENQPATWYFDPETNLTRVLLSMPLTSSYLPLQTWVQPLVGVSSCLVPGPWSVWALFLLSPLLRHL